MYFSHNTQLVCLCDCSRKGKEWKLNLLQLIKQVKIGKSLSSKSSGSKLRNTKWLTFSLACWEGEGTGHSNPLSHIRIISICTVWALKGRKASRPILQRKPFKHQLRANKRCAKSTTERKPGCQKVSLPLPWRAERDRQIVYAYSHPEVPTELLTLDGQTPVCNSPLDLDCPIQRAQRQGMGKTRLLYFPIQV